MFRLNFFSIKKKSQNPSQQQQQFGLLSTSVNNNAIYSHGMTFSKL